MSTYVFSAEQVIARIIVYCPIIGILMFVDFLNGACGSFDDNLKGDKLEFMQLLARHVAFVRTICCLPLIMIMAEVTLHALHRKKFLTVLKQAIQILCYRPVDNRD